jgi:hypothetical protein
VNRDSKKPFGFQNSLQISAARLGSHVCFVQALRYFRNFRKINNTVTMSTVEEILAKVLEPDNESIRTVN